ncbi:hypothetical protein GO730_15010 [Spirosoma sp. HMF3257]|uniref:Uncharacterized protein n=1 Tax=Spirosoma telluris TaxID=2183553 RepID=A0A327NIF7_9BACT|nr:hypothetical protein [Spirosoma telluris]RAI75170.1 hypothetical protein HMF3257_14955 [Spirosoma telluris]
MIKKSLLISVGLLLIYTILIVHFSNRFNLVGQTTSQENMVKVEDYLYQAGMHRDTILVGSSMSERLVTDSLPGRCYNLAMSGMSSLDGLQIIKQGGHWPRLVYIELNTLARGYTSGILNKFDEPGWQFLLTYFPFLRQKYQPVAIFKSLLYNRHRTPSPVGLGQPVDTLFYEKVVHEKLVVMQQMPSDSALKANVQLAYQYIEQLQQHGVKVIFFEIPTDLRLQNHVLTATIRQYIHNFFPPVNTLLLTYQQIPIRQMTVFI